MKTILTSVLTAALLGFASRLSGRAFAAADFTAVFFAAGLVAWTVEQYSREHRALSVDRPIRFPVQLARNQAKVPVTQLAA